jgi:hypothetical protein
MTAEKDQMMVDLMIQLVNLREKFKQNTEELCEMKRRRLPLLTGDYKKSYDQSVNI